VVRRTRLEEGKAGAASEKNLGRVSHRADPFRLVLRMSSDEGDGRDTQTDPFAAAPAPMQKWLDFSKGILQIGLEESLMELVEIRASQINGCAACLHMHTAAARKRGESEERLYLLDAWRESPLYSARERAALAWTEALTLVSETHAPDEAYQALQAQFTPEEQVALTLLIVTINGWNRVQIGFRGVHPVAKREAA
jgi:AhpD family alkylhydroperoxidase